MRQTVQLPDDRSILNRSTQQYAAHRILPTDIEDVAYFPHDEPPGAPGAPMHGREVEAVEQAISDYWRRNVRLKIILLSIWAFVSIVLSILMINVLNEASIGGFPLGFWMAQQGSIFVFVVLIFVYAKTMDRYDTELEATLQGMAGGNA